MVYISTSLQISSPLTRFQTSSSGLPPKPPSLPHTTRNLQFHPERFKPRKFDASLLIHVLTSNLAYDLSSPANLPNTLFRKAPRLSQSTHQARNKRLDFLLVFIGFRICFSFGASSQDDDAGVIRDSRVSLMRYGWFAFLRGHMSSRSAFGVRGCTIT